MRYWSRRIWMLRSVMILLGMLVLPSLTHAQTAAVIGTVEDPSGAVVTGAAAKATNVATAAERSTETNETGLYRISNLAPGVYVISIEKSGFKAVRFEDVTLTVDQILTLNAKLEVSAVAESVTVTEAAVAPVDTETGTISNIVDSQRVTELPLLTRDPYQLILLSPGVIQSNSGLGGFSANGTRERNNNFLLDGVDNNDTDVPGIPGGLNALNPDSTQEFRVITNNFAPEFGRNNGAIIDVVTKSGTNQIHGTAYEFGRYNALGARDFFNHTPNTPQNPYVRNDFGASAGGPIIKDKTFWFVNYEGQRFITTLTNQAIVPTTAFKTGKFTFAGSPIDVSTPGSPNNALGLTLDPAVQKILALYPAPNGPAVDDARGILFFPSASRTTNDDFTIKIDQHIGGKHTLSGRYAFNRSQDPNPFHSDILPGNLGAIGVLQRTQNLALDLSSTVSNTLLNDLRFGANRTNLPFTCAGTNVFDSFGGVDSVGRGPDFNFGSIQPFGCQVLGDTNKQQRFTGTYQTLDNMTLVHGNHSFKWGGEFRDVYANSFDSFTSRAVLDFSDFSNIGVATLGNPASCTAMPTGPNCLPAAILGNTPLQNEVASLLGLVDTQTQSQFFNSAGARTVNDLRGFRQREVAFFGQDSWKVRPNLTFNYGMRWEYYGVPFEVNNQLSNLFADASGTAPFTFSVVGQHSGGQLYRDDLRGFEPRVGLAWDPFKTGKTSVRAGFGLFRDRVFGNLFGNARGNPPFQETFFTVPVAQVTGLPTPTTVPASPTVANGAGIFPIIFDPNFKVPYSENWNFGIQRELRSSLTIEVNYVGVKGSRLFRVVDGNAPQPSLVAALEALCVPTNPANTTGCTQSTLQFTNLYFGAPTALPFNAVNNNAFFHAALNKSIANSTYHGLQLNVTKRMSNGFQIQGAYTYSHAIDDASDPLNPAAGNGNFPVNSFNLRAERGNSDFDVRQRGVINYIYQPNIGRGRGHFSEGLLGRVLEGWELTGITTIQSGHPFDIFGVLDTQHTGIADRATIIGNPRQPSGAGRTATGPALSAFTEGAFGTASNLGRNTFYGPGIVNFDTSLAKNTAITERLKFELRLEAYNLFNRPQFAQPGNNLGNPGTFGFSTATLTQPDGTTSARQLQVAGKIIF